MRYSSHDTSKIVGSLLIGTAVGVALGTLFARESGASTRRRIADKTRDLFDSMKLRYEEVTEEAKRAYEAGREKASAFAEDLREDFNEGMRKGRDKATAFSEELKEDLHMNFRESGDEFKEDPNESPDARIA